MVGGLCRASSSRPNPSAWCPSQEVDFRPIREEVRTQGDQIRSDAESNRANFDSKTEIIKSDDGTLASKKSLLVQSGKQVGEDAAATLDDAKDAVKDLLRK